MPKGVIAAVAALFLKHALRAKEQMDGIPYTLSFEVVTLCNWRCRRSSHCALESLHSDHFPVQCTQRPNDHPHWVVPAQMWILIDPISPLL